LEQAHLLNVAQRFAALQATLASIGGTHAAERVELPRSTLQTLARNIDAGLPAAEASRAIDRMLLEPVEPSLQRLGRYACALAARLGKPEPRLTIEDGGLLVDGRRAAPLFSVLVHLIRNAVDHGLETRDELAAAGKGDPTLLLSADVTDGGARFIVRDSGRGIDWERVRERAKARGLPSNTQAELTDALFAPEFSTRDSATTTSGRGVGLAAVQAEVSRLSGHLRVESEMGHGTTFRIEVPAEALGFPASGLVQH
jgi:two-component system chemotaxis sensor kinase CheA